MNTQKVGKQCANKGVANTKIILRRKPHKSRYRIRHNSKRKPNQKNKHINCDIDQMRANAIRLQRDPLGIGNIRKLIQTRAIHHRTNQTTPQTPELAQITEHANTARSNKTWTNPADICANYNNKNSRPMNKIHKRHSRLKCTQGKKKLPNSKCAANTSLRES